MEKVYPIKSQITKQFFNTMNKPLIEYAIEYAQTIKFNPKIIYQLNFIRMKKISTSHMSQLGLKETSKLPVSVILVKKAPYTRI